MNANTFLNRLEAKVSQQLGSQHVGYLLGAGASYLDGKGYPLAGELWNHIATNIRSPERGEIQEKNERRLHETENLKTIYGALRPPPNAPYWR